jgi:DNA-binding transcriptional MerR regulator
MLLPDSGRWNLEQFAEAANRLLPHYLPDVRRDSRMSDAVNPRLVRHYTSLRLLDEPHKEGKEARYTRRHLLQLLVLRRLLAEGYATSAIAEVTSRPDEALESLLHGATQLEIAPSPPASNPALDYLQRLSSAPPPARSGHPPNPSWTHAEPSLLPPDPKPEAATRWTRSTIRPGLEIHLSEHFRFPRTPSERAALLRDLEQLLQDNKRK